MERFQVEGSRIQIWQSAIGNQHRLSAMFLSFNADYLFDLSDDFNQIFLVFHHRFD